MGRTITAQVNWQGAIFQPFDTIPINDGSDGRM